MRWTDGNTSGWQTWMETGMNRVPWKFLEKAFTFENEGFLVFLHTYIGYYSNVYNLFMCNSKFLVFMRNSFILYCVLYKKLIL